MSKDENKKSKSFKSIQDILNTENDISFDDDDEFENYEVKMEKTKEAVKQMKEEFQKIKDLDDDDFSKSILKSLVEKAMGMLTALQLEVEDNPTGRSVETAAAMVSAINGVVDNFNKIKVYNTKLDIEQQKLDLKKSSIQKGIENKSGNTNILMVGDSNSILDLLNSKGIIPNDSPKMKDISDSIDIKDDDEDN